MTFVRTALIGGALTAAAACGGGSGCGAGAMADTAGWQVVDAGPFVFKLPPAHRREPGFGVDSYVGRWSHGERLMGFDYGQYTRDPRRAPGREREGRVCTERIAGREVAVHEMKQAAPEGKRHYRFVGWWRLGPERDDTLGQPHLRLSASAPAQDAEGQAQARAIVRSVRIRSVWTEQDRLRDRHRQCRDLREHARGQPPNSYVDQELRRCPSGAPPPPADYESVR